MSGIFQSAFGYFSTPTIVQSENSFVGQNIEISNIKLRIKSVIAEGGFAVVFVAQDVSTGNDYALKRLLAADEESKRNVMQEISILKKLAGHANIIQYLSASYVDKAHTSHGQCEFLVVTELCTGGSLIGLLQSRSTAFDPETICRIFYQTCKAVAFMHSQSEPIIHRDLKIENLLITGDGMIKLCDFGSATTEIFRPDMSWTANQRSTLEDNMARFTTPMYRAPEMVDTWNNFFVGSPVDIWALGCIMYMLCYMKHPFEDSAKLRIINANYTLPPDPKYSCFHDIIRGCFQVDPEKRFNISALLERVAAIAESNGFNLRAPLDIKELSNINDFIPVDTCKSNGMRAPPVRPAQPSPVHQPSRPPPPVPQTSSPIPQRPTPLQQSRQSDPKISSGGLFSSIKGGAGSFLKNLKDTSSKVMQTMQQSIARSDLDISYITSRIIVMPYPSEGIESAYRTNHVDDVKIFLDTRHPNSKYSVYNLSGRTYHSKFGQARIVDCGFAYPEHFKAPLLNSLYQLCEDIYQYLAGDSRNVCVIHCLDGKATSSTLTCALLMYSGLYEVPEDALQMFAVKRIPPNMRASELRYLYYLADVIRNPPLYPHYKPVTLVSLQMQPVPLFTKIRDGCRPYVEVYSDNHCIISTMQDYERMRLFNITDGKCILQLNVNICGDVCIVVYHARNILGGVMTQGKATGIKICQLQFHTGFMSEEETCLRFTRSELDDVAEGHDHFQERFVLSVSVFVSDSEKQPSQPAPWMTDKTVRCMNTVFSSQIEKEETVDNFVSKSVSKPNRSPLISDRPSRPPPPSPQPHMNFGGKDSSDSEAEIIPANFVEQTEPQLLEEAVDLLNLNSFSNPTNSTPKKSPSSNFDLLSDLSDATNAFGNFKSSSTGQQMFHNPASKVTVKSTNDLFDPFGTSTNDFVRGWSDADTSSIPVTPSAPNNGNKIENQEQPKDFFSGLGNLNANWTSNSTPNLSTNDTNSPHKAPPTTPQHGLAATPQTGPATTPQHFAKSPVDNRPDYSRSHFETVLNKNDPKMKFSPQDVFGDLLGSQGYQFAAKRENMPRTINDMRKEELVRDMDPDKLKIMEWVEGKKHNIRALLCSLHTVVWDGAKWNKCDMHQLVSAADVKKAYRRACLAVHPDKQSGTENENIAKLIFMEMNNAWSDFENDASQQNMFAR